MRARPPAALVVFAALALGGCAADREVTIEATVLDEGSGPILCQGLVLQSFPPQCEGVALRDWSWDVAEGATTVRETTWGEYAVTGSWDGGTFVVTRPPDTVEAKP